jgi:hypothetical protein
LAPAESQAVDAGDLDRIAALAARALAHAPFPDAKVVATSPRESVLRTYLAAFGMHGPPRLEPRSPKVDILLGETVLALTRGRSPATLIYVASPMPDEERWKELGPKLSLVRRPRTRLHWLHAAEAPGLEPSPDVLGRVARTAARLRAEGERNGAELRLRRLGIRPAVCGPQEPPLQLEALGSKGSAHASG